MEFFQDGKIVLVILSEFPTTAGEVCGFGHSLFLEDNLHLFDLKVVWSCF